MPTNPPKKKSRRGFAAMSPELQRHIASLGGKAGHAQGRAHQYTTEEAKAAGSKSGKTALRGRHPPARV